MKLLLSLEATKQTLHRLVAETDKETIMRLHPVFLMLSTVLLFAGCDGARDYSPTSPAPPPAASAPPPAAVQISGPWNGTVTVDNDFDGECPLGDFSARATFEQTDSNVTGELTTNAPCIFQEMRLEGTLQGYDLSLRIVNPGTLATFTGVVSTDGRQIDLGLDDIHHGQLHRSREASVKGLAHGAS